MPERESSRLIAWNNELRRVHTRMRDALELTRAALDKAVESDNASLDSHESESVARELLLYYHGFCVALDGHHRGEDRTLFPAIAAAHPDLAPVLRALERDHSMIGHLLGGLQNAVDQLASASELSRHVEGIAAIMESHFRYEERQLLTVLSTLELDADPRTVLGPL